MPLAAYLLVLVLGLAAGALSGVIGTGSSIILLPIIVYQYGPQRAVPIMAIASLMVNIGKVLAWWREVNWRAFAAYTIPGMPAAALGARTLLILPPRAVDIALGLFFLAMIPAQRWLRRQDFEISLWQLAIAGAVIGFVTGIVLSTGPLSVPAFTSHGLLKGAFLATEAMSSLALMASKVATFRQFGALPWPSILQGLIIGAAVMIGAFIGKAIVQKMSLKHFVHVLDLMLAGSGLSMLFAALR